MSHCSYTALDATVASRNRTGLRRNMAAMLIYFNDLVWLDVKKVLEGWKMIPRTKNNKIVTFVNKDLLNPVKEAGTQTTCCTNTHTHTLY